MPTGAVPIVTPCHGLPIRIIMSTVGSGWSSHEEPDVIECDEPGCINMWTPRGEPFEANR
jgi:hypothetical protein